MTRRCARRKAGAGGTSAGSPSATLAVAGMTMAHPAAERLAERLKPGNTADIMRRIEERLEVFRKSDFAAAANC